MTQDLPASPRGFSNLLGCRPASRGFFFNLVVCCFLLAAAYHLMGYLNPGALDDASAPRHLSFVLIDAAWAMLFWFQFRWLHLIFIPFALHQFYHHGTQLHEHYKQFQSQCWIDLAVLAFVAGVLFVLIRNLGSQSPASSGAGVADSMITH